jgi:formamidopyrimidine-DNA glycosylase
MKHRWVKGKKDAAKLPNGDRIIFLTVGGRTSAVVPSVQKKTGEVAGDVPKDAGKSESNGSEAKGKAKKSIKPEVSEKVNVKKEASEKVNGKPSKKNQRKEADTEEPEMTQKNKKQKIVKEEEEEEKKPTGISRSGKKGASEAANVGRRRSARISGN